MAISNYGVYVQGGENETINNDYYGILTDIIEVYYTGWQTKMLVLFKCDWFDPTPNQGTKIENNGHVEVKASKKYKHYDPFIFSQQPKQVYFAQYPEGHNDWLVVVKTKARNTIQTLESNSLEKDVPYKEESITQSPMIIASDNLEESLVDIDGDAEEVYAHILNQLEFEMDEEVEIEEEEQEVEDDDDGNGDCDNHGNGDSYFFYFISLFCKTS